MVVPTQQPAPSTTVIMPPGQGPTGNQGAPGATSATGETGATGANGTPAPQGQ